MSHPTGRRLPSLLVVLIVLVAASLLAAVPAFAAAGFLSLAPPGQTTALGQRVAVDAAGRVLLLSRTKAGGSFLTRRLPDGAVDPEFAGGGWASAPAGEWEDVAVDPQGRILLSGSLEEDLAVARLNPDGTPDQSFGAGGVVRIHADLPAAEPLPRERLARLVALPDGGIVAAGSIGFCFGADCSHASGVVVRLTAAGVPDPSFAGGGIDMFALAPRLEAGRGRGVLREVSALAVQPDGKILVGGTDSRTVVVDRLSGEGAPDPTFGDAGIFLTNQETDGEDEARGGGEGLFYPGSARSILVEPSGGIVVVGIRLMYGLRPDGRLDPRFGYPESGASWRGVSGNGPTSEQTDAVLDESGRIVVVGKLGGEGPGISRFLPNGRADRRYGKRGLLLPRLGNALPPAEVGFTPTLTSVALLPSGNLVAAGAGYFGRGGPHPRAIVLRRPSGPPVRDR